MIAVAVPLGLLGLIFGSFVNAFVWRLHEGKDWIKGRSQCVNCGHELSPADLVPVISWLLLKGRCRYCRKPISKQYPIVELGTAAVFVLSYFFWPMDLSDNGQKLLFISWLIMSVGLMSLAVYDWRWMILPTRLIHQLLILAVLSRGAYIVFFEPNISHALLEWLGSVAVASGIFWLLYQFSDGKYIGFGDVRLGLVTGTILATPINSFLMIFFASILGTLFSLPGLLSKERKLSARIPYGPFLIAATFIVILFGQRLSNWYSNLTF